MKPLRSLLPILVFLLYLRLPFDLLPDRLGGIGFLDDLVVLALLLWWFSRKRTAADPSRAAAEPAEERWDPYRVLGVSEKATREEVTRAYREALKRYHPDRVASLGDELQRLAHRKTLEIQKAYRELTGR
ncbi:MAG: hypothetical protein KatS3mg076_2094 [Candidatus Binatia bacterium]|nr:MAG: hypothetical protein KatS3mg076_2094 [Candidatus Binatia bacterium]